MNKKEKKIFFGDKAGEIKKRYSPIMAARQLGLEVRRSGSDWSILCPSQEHSDRNFGSCKISGDGRVCHCFVCDKTFSGIDILMEAGGDSWYEAMLTAAGALGMAGELEDGPDQGKRRKSPDVPRLSSEERRLLGLDPWSFRNRRMCAEVVGSSPVEPEGPFVREYDPDTGEPTGYVRTKDMSYSLERLMADSPAAYKELVRIKAKGVFNEATAAIQDVIGGPRGLCGLSEPELELVSAWNEMRRTADALYVRFGGKTLAKAG